MWADSLADGAFFVYLDMDGKTKDVYSWRLDHNNPYPKDRQKDLSLLEKENQFTCVAKEKMCDAIIIASMDQDHYTQTMKAPECGYMENKWNEMQNIVSKYQ